MNKHTSLIERIKKLYEKAKNLKELGSFEEAKIFFGKVEKLLLENSLSINEIENYQKGEKIFSDENREAGVEFYKKEFLYEGQFWEIELMSVITKHNFCYVYYNLFKDNTFMSKRNLPPFMTLVGRPSDIEICKYLFEVSRDLFRNLAPIVYDNVRKEIRENFSVKANSKINAYINFIKKINDFIFNPPSDIITSSSSIEKYLTYEKVYKRLSGLDYKLKKTSYKKSSFGPNDFIPESYKVEDLDKEQKYFVKDLAKFALISDRNTFIRSFLLGVSTGLDEQFEQSKRELFKEEPEKYKKINALILKSNNELEEYKKSHISNMETINGTKPMDTLGYESGVEAGRENKINKGLSTSSDTGKFIKTIN